LTISQEEKLPSPEPQNSRPAAYAKKDISDKETGPFHNKRECFLLATVAKKRIPRKIASGVPLGERRQLELLFTRT